MKVLAALCLAMLHPIAARATTVQVRVLNVGSDAGTVRVAVCSREQFLKPRCAHVAHEPARRGVVVVAVDGVPEGTYAVQAYHDVNGNGRIDTTFFGVPKEGIGFSHDAPFHFGPPRFADAALSVSGALVTLDITLKFEP